MNNFERVKLLVDEYVSKNGTSTEMTRNEFISWAGESIPGISVEKNNPKIMQKVTLHYSDSSSAA